MKKILLAGTAALVLAGSTAVYAQHRHWGHGFSRMSPEDRSAYADARIAAVHAGLKLNADQEKLWPAVETALRAVAHKIHSARKANPNATAASQIDPDSDEVQQLKSAAMPLLFQLREDQKREVRSLARLIGLEKVAAQI